MYSASLFQQNHQSGRLSEVPRKQVKDEQNAPDVIKLCVKSTDLDQTPDTVISQKIIVTP